MDKKRKHCFDLFKGEVINILLHRRFLLARWSDQSKTAWQTEENLKCLPACGKVGPSAHLRTETSKHDTNTIDTSQWEASVRHRGDCWRLHHSYLWTLRVIRDESFIMELYFKFLNEDMKMECLSFVSCQENKWHFNLSYIDFNHHLPIRKKNLYK